jgi:GAF domain-containing protein
MRLASLAQTTSTQAATLADSAELIARLEHALELVRTEFDAPSEVRHPSFVPPAPEQPGERNEEGRVLRQYLKAIADLMSQRSLFVGDLEATVRRVTEAAALTLEIDRVSVWFLDEQRTKIVCADLFEQRAARHSSGQVMLAKDYAVYFEALSYEQTVAAHDANTDPRTSCFSQGYLEPLGIGALIDVPIWVGGAMAGVICHEHVGGKRTWTNDEETFAYVMSGLIALTLEQRTHAAVPAPAPAPRREERRVLRELPQESEAEMMARAELESFANGDLGAPGQGELGSELQRDEESQA